MISIVLGAFYGDEGKGQFVSYLAKKNKRSIVIRFNGGHQAGHTVVREDGYRHVFSSFCSGALHGAASHISRFCTVSPAALYKEYEALLANRDENTNLNISIDPRCPIVTPFDMIANQIRHLRTGGNQTVGVGFGDTIERHENTPYKLFASDLASPMLKAKVESIRNYYKKHIKPSKFTLTSKSAYVFKEPLSSEEYDLIKLFDNDNLINEFLQYVDRLFLMRLKVQSLNNVVKGYDDLIFEGAQGIQLDMEHGVFPYVTRSKTTSKNAFELIEELPDITKFFAYFQPKNLEINTYYIMRPYITRHGDGPIPEGHFDVQEDQTNILNKFQGNLRFAPFSLPLLKHSSMVDYWDTITKINRQFNFVITHSSIHPELATSVAKKIRFENTNRQTNVMTFDSYNVVKTEIVKVEE